MHVCNREDFGYIDEDIESAEESRESHVFTRMQHLIGGANKTYRTALPTSSYLFESLPNEDKEANTRKLGFDKIYVINLARRRDRRERIEAALSDLGLHYEIFDAFDAKKINDSYIHSLGIALIPNYLDPYNQRPLNFGEIGCFLSHYFIWQDVIILFLYL